MARAPRMRRCLRARPSPVESQLACNTSLGVIHVLVFRQNLCDSHSLTFSGLCLRQEHRQQDSGRPAINRTDSIALHVESRAVYLELRLAPLQVALPPQRTQLLTASTTYDHHLLVIC